MAIVSCVICYVVHMILFECPFIYCLPDIKATTSCVGARHQLLDYSNRGNNAVNDHYFVWKVTLQQLIQPLLWVVL